ncbi:Crp/Fnr family transcriptional regulator [Devosia sp.]|uniref:Crp/Fnr family transcriptional regulator n=1 Tax=Devosia sp. TaxID=1871048 RepID=UPI00326798D0
MNQTPVSLTVETPVPCRGCHARHKGLCGALNAAELTALSRYTRVVKHLAGSEIAGEETEIYNYANVMSGVIKLSRVLEDGRQQVIGLKFSPDFMGRIYGTDNIVAVRAASDVELCQIPKKVLEVLVETNRALERRLMIQTLRELDEAREWMVTLGRKTASERLASCLYLIALHIDPSIDIGEGTAIEYDLPLTRADIADFLGLSLETVSRQMTLLRKSGVIQITRKRHIEIGDVDKLRKLCG